MIRDHLEQVGRAPTAVEGLFLHLDRIAPLDFLVWLEGEASIDLARVADAIVGLGAQGLIGSRRLAEDRRGATRIVEAPSSSVPVTLSDSLNAGHLEAELRQPINPRHAPPLRGFCARLCDGRWRIGLVLHHAFADARHGFALLHDAMTTASGRPAAGVGAFGPLTLPSMSREAARAAKRAVRPPENVAAPPTPIPGYSAHGSVPVVAMDRIDLSAAEVARLLKTCRDHCVRPQALLTAIQACALSSGAIDQVQGLISPVDLRDGCRAAIALGFAVQRVGVRPGLRPLELARRLQANLDEQSSSRSPEAMLAQLPLPPARPVDDETFDLFRIARHFLHGSILSNVGRLQAGCGAGACHAGVLVTPQPGQPLYTAVVTGPAGMSLTLCHDRTRWEEDSIAAVQKEWRRLLRETVGGDVRSHS